MGARRLMIPATNSAPRRPRRLLTGSDAQLELLELYECGNLQTMNRASTYMVAIAMYGQALTNPVIQEFL